MFPVKITVDYRNIPGSWPLNTFSLSLISMEWGLFQRWSQQGKSNDSYDTGRKKIMLNLIEAHKMRAHNKDSKQGFFSPHLHYIFAVSSNDTAIVIYKRKPAVSLDKFSRTVKIMAFIYSVYLDSTVSEVLVMEVSRALLIQLCWMCFWHWGMKDIWKMLRHNHIFVWSLPSLACYM